MKKYFWLKLHDDFFRQKEIKKLRRIAGGDTYTIIYLKLQLLSIKNEGKLFFEEIEDNFPKEIALELDEDEENVHMTVLFLEKHNLLECSLRDENEYTLPAVLSCIGKESESAERVRKHRKTKALQCNNLVTKCNTETETETEIEIETEQQLEDVVEIFRKYRIDIESALRQKPDMFFHYEQKKIEEVAKYLAQKNSEGKIQNPVGYLLKDPEKIIEMILSSTQKQKSKYELYISPEEHEELRAQKS